MNCKEKKTKKRHHSVEKESKNTKQNRTHEQHSKAPAPATQRSVLKLSFDVKRKRQRTTKQAAASQHRLSARDILDADYFGVFLLFVFVFFLLFCFAFVSLFFAYNFISRQLQSRTHTCMLSIFKMLLFTVI